MKAEMNQVERFQNIAKRLVDEHSAAFFTRTIICHHGDYMVVHEAYNAHLNTLDKELIEQASNFLSSFKSVNDTLKQEIWRLCHSYVDQFARRNQPQL